MAMARAAEPLLAASLVGDGEMEGLFEGVVDGLGKARMRGREGVLATGVRSVDAALDGGIDRAAVVGVSCESGGVGVDFSFAFLTSFLLDPGRPMSMAAVVDTTGNLDIFRLYTLIVARLRADDALFSTFRNSFGDAVDFEKATVEDVAAKVLDRVKIMRVFDLVGVMEAVGEIRDELEGPTKPATVPVRLIVHEESQNIALTEEREVRDEPPPKKTVIQDSEDEDDEEILFENEDVYTTERYEPRTAAGAPIPDPVPDPQTGEGLKNEGTQTDGKVSFVLIDNLAHVVSPLLKKDYIHAHALTSTFLLTLSNLTRTHSLHTILLNPLNVPRPPASQQTQQQQPPPPPPPPSPSIFSSNNLIPALGSLLAPYLDLHLLVHRMPKGKRDARVMYADDGNGRSSAMGKVRGGKGVELVGIVEIVADRRIGRVGDWGAFAEGEHGIGNC